MGEMTIIAGMSLLLAFLLLTVLVLAMAVRDLVCASERLDRLQAEADQLERRRPVNPRPPEYR